MSNDVIYLTNDLMFSSRVMSLAKQFAVPLRIASSRQVLLSQITESSPSLVIIDLEHPDAKMDQLADEMKSLEKRPRVIAYGPHVKQSMLDAAQAAGAEVLSRGSFDKQVASILQSLAQA